MHKVAKLVKAKEVKSIFVTGYSLGGSLAILSTPFWAHFKKEHIIPVYIMGFSGARIGNLEAKLHFESLGIPINRYTNRDDIVPQIPPRSLGYTHIGLEIHERSRNIIGSELIVCSQEYDEDPDCAWGEPSFRNPIPHLAPFNHPMVVPPYCGLSSMRINLPNYA
ncbi:hypothetical protein DSO57_1012633 [Entomophthora muscae]|uniref:Uncharacterized protein n=1 Tax=Entomophthora muscae TaxID=34485 RepID=A0ACC2S7X2_9FUNG|nr:hypothetical protein DSO57_1012633 [Entomophthora muscae]